MKTTFYLSTVLALAIQVMGYGQTSGSQIHKVRMDIMGMPKPAATAPVCISASPELPGLSVLIEQANTLALTAQKLKEEAKKAEQQLLLTQIEVSTLTASLHYKQFDRNKLTIAPLLDKLEEGTYLFAKAHGLDKQACYFIKTARELREEAGAQFTNEARYGNMTNAEVYEKLALDKQDEVIGLLQQHADEALPVKEEIVEVKASKGGSKNAVDASLAEALTQAGDLKETARRLRDAAATKEAQEKNMMLAEAKNMEKEYILKEVEASEITGKLNQEVFYRNRQLIAALISNTKDNKALLDKVKMMNGQAERFLRMGIEMREEANAQFTTAARYGDMSNAEEEEMLALDTQQQVLSLMGQAGPGIALR